MPPVTQAYWYKGSSPTTLPPMADETGIHLFLLLLSLAGILFATSSMERDAVLRGRVLLPDPTSDRPCILHAQIGQRTRHERLKASGKFRLTIPSGGHAVLTFVQGQQTISTIRIWHRVGRVRGSFPSRPVFDLGDIALREWGPFGYNMRVHYWLSDEMIVSAGTEPGRNAPLDRQLLDHSFHFDPRRSVMDSGLQTWIEMRRVIPPAWLIERSSEHDVTATYAPSTTICSISCYRVPDMNELRS